MFILAGLGNPGKEYEDTRHNIGFKAIDKIISRFSLSESKKFHSIFANTIIANEKVILLKPQKYMNRSGISLQEAVNFYKVPLENIIVIHDELDIATGKIKVKKGGGSAGHNGIKDIANKIGNDFIRIRIGIDHPGNNVSDYVLSNFKNDEKIIMDNLTDYLANNIELILNNEHSKFTDVNLIN